MASRGIPEINRELAERINSEARADPKSPYAGKFVGIANGKVVIVAETPDEVEDALDHLEPDPLNTYIIEASKDYDQVEYIWDFTPESSHPACAAPDSHSAPRAPHRA